MYQYRVAKPKYTKTATFSIMIHPILMVLGFVDIAFPIAFCPAAKHPVFLAGILSP